MSLGRIVVSLLQRAAFNGGYAAVNAVRKAAAQRKPDNMDFLLKVEKWARRDPVKFAPFYLDLCSTYMKDFPPVTQALKQEVTRRICDDPEGLESALSEYIGALKYIENNDYETFERIQQQHPL
ncbi:MAG: hypothetical protein K0U74_12190 [Alphaproteobacteria bacterium]|nr:hypothetical protein [Alphaproteobacteria bacterium]